MPNNQPVTLSSLVNCTCFAVTHWKLVHVFYMFFSFCPVPQNSCILCPENASSFSENRRSTLTTKIEKPVAVLRICAGARRRKKTACFSSICCDMAESSDGGRVRVPICRSREEGMQCSGRRWIPLPDHAEQWQQPQRTKKNISRCCPPRISPPPTQTHIYGPHMGYISWRVGLKVPISSHVHICSPTVHLPMPPVRTEPLQRFSTA